MAPKRKLMADREVEDEFSSVLCLKEVSLGTGEERRLDKPNVEFEVADPAFDFSVADFSGWDSFVSVAAAAPCFC